MLSTDADVWQAEALALGRAMAQVSRPWREPFAGSDIRDCFEIHGTSYLVMDFQPGTTLAQMLDNGETFTEADLLALLSSVAAGLDRAHRVGVLHGRSEEHTSELQSLMRISYAVFCLKKKKKTTTHCTPRQT